MSAIDDVWAFVKPSIDVLVEVSTERRNQDIKWGVQNHPNGTGPDAGWLGVTAVELEDYFSASCKADEAGQWSSILLEEVFEAMAEHDPAALRAELLQVAAVAVAWIEAIDRRA